MITPESLASKDCEVLLRHLTEGTEKNHKNPPGLWVFRLRFEPVTTECDSEERQHEASCFKKNNIVL
jgi:hypothetical protein